MSGQQVKRSGKKRLASSAFDVVKNGAFFAVGEILVLQMHALPAYSG